MLSTAIVIFRESLEISLIMGIVNVTPDSFSDGRRYLVPLMTGL